MHSIFLITFVIVIFSCVNCSRLPLEVFQHHLTEHRLHHHRINHNFSAGQKKKTISHNVRILYQVGVCKKNKPNLHFPAQDEHSSCIALIKRRFSYWNQNVYFVNFEASLLKKEIFLSLYSRSRFVIARNCSIKYHIISNFDFEISADYKIKNTKHAQ